MAKSGVIRGKSPDSLPGHEMLPLRGLRVCENHPHKSWEGARACNCGDASAQWCNQSDPSTRRRAPWWPSADDPDGCRELRPRTAFLKKAPAIGDGCQSREETLRNVSQFAGALRVAIHTCIKKLREPPGTKVRRGPEPAPLYCAGVAGFLG